MKVTFIIISILFLSTTVFSQSKYTLNDSIIMCDMKFCYFGDSIQYNGLKDEFRVPLPKCSDVTFHSFEAGGGLYVVYPRHWEYCGSGGCHIYLMKNINGKYHELDEIWGNLDIEKSKLSQNTFYYLKTDKSSFPYKEFEKYFVVDLINENFKFRKYHH